MRRPRSPMFIDQRPVCWLAPFDETGAECDGRYEAIHLIGRQAIRNSPTLYGLDSELIELAEWDVRNGAPGCTRHHRRFDNHATPELIVPTAALPDDTLEFIVEWGLEPEAQRRFDGFLQVVLDARQPAILAASP